MYCSCLLFSENSNLKEKDILVLPLDLTDTSSHEAATKAVLQEFGKVSCVSYQRSMAGVLYLSKSFPTVDPLQRERDAEPVQ